MSAVTCPRCEAEVPEGGFCSQCGASLQPRGCPSCGAEAPPGDRFCTRCGASLTAVAGSGAGPDGEAGTGNQDRAFRWWIGGLVVAAVAVALLVSVLQPDRGLRDDASPGAGARTDAAPGMGAAPNVDLSSMTPREAADRLFDRVMIAAEQGDSAEARNFLPMAIAAYDRARPLDEDGLFHLSVLHRTATDEEAALNTAREGLAEHPDHLLLLSAAGEAARQLGDTAAARRHFERLLRVWEEERASGREEYRAHQELLPRIRDDARAFLEGT